MYIIVWQCYETEHLNTNGANCGTVLFLSARSITFFTHVITLNTNFVTLLNKEFWK